MPVTLPSSFFLRNNKMEDFHDLITYLCKKEYDLNLQKHMLSQKDILDILLTDHIEDLKDHLFNIILNNADWDAIIDDIQENVTKHQEESEEEEEEEKTDE
jgi:hypothetical protein